MRRPLRHGNRGVSLVEFVIVFPLAALFVLALIQAGFLYMAKLTLNHATFMAARAGSLNHANRNTIRTALVKGLIPFYQDSSVTNDAQRLIQAGARAAVDTLIPGRLTIDMLNPSAQAFRDFGVRDTARNVTFIPNDNLQYRTQGMRTARMTIQDANLLKLRVVYGYELKVPLIAYVLRWTMCSGDSGVAAWGNVSWLQAIAPASPHCLLYYRNGRVPIESFATIEMQTRAEQP